MPAAATARDHLWHLELFDVAEGDARRVHDEPIPGAAFDRARLAAFWDALKADPACDMFAPEPAEARVSPVFLRRTAGSPRVASIEVTVPLAGGSSHRARFDIDYFKSRVKRLTTELVRDGRVPE